ncbi:hypothetical protein [Sinorhizobium meliloti]|uniref:hypothetical protein n=1 Tax=Rhizobium meliloti TaxID=382 RepID=UPI000B49D2CD|nr:hypothetical protein [Sinorhizobium meliloti]ASP66414.1 hypothetical protein CDO29_17365 [Sinorhizobium meliloti]MQX01616.1 hypothetical protein [Sinorhizobium meliloti]RVK39518.1 hypothetical protein CN160_34925 [Sinorhizobium meliloti]
MIDIDADAVKAAVQMTTLDDLSVNDSVLVYQNFCIKDDRLFVPGWTSPSNLGTANYSADSVILRAIVLPGKKLKMTYIDSAQAQSVAKGNTNAPPVLSTEDYKKEVREDINRLFTGGLFTTVTCDEQQRQNPLRKLTVYEVESINGFNSLSELLKSVSR